MAVKLCIINANLNRPYEFIFYLNEFILFYSPLEDKEMKRKRIAFGKKLFVTQPIKFAKHLRLEWTEKG